MKGMMSRTRNTNPYEIQNYDRSLPGVIYHDHLESGLQVDCDYSPKNGPRELHEKRTRAWRYGQGTRCSRSSFYAGGIHSFGGNARWHKQQISRRVRSQTNITLHLMTREGADTQLEIAPSHLTRRHIIWMLS